MRKAIIIAALAIAGAIGVAMVLDNRDSGTPAAGPTASLTESAAPSESVPTTVVDFRKDVTDVKAEPADKAQFPEGNAAHLTFTITNHGGDTSSYQITFSVADESGAVVGTILVDSEISGLGDAKPGGVIKADGVWTMDGKLPAHFTVAVESVDREPVAE